MTSIIAKSCDIIVYCLSHALPNNACIMENGPARIE